MTAQVPPEPIPPSTSEETRTSGREQPMFCPRCHYQLIERRRNGVQIDVCSGCRGIWLDRGELERLLDRAVVEWLDEQETQSS